MTACSARAAAALVASTNADPDPAHDAPRATALVTGCRCDRHPPRIRCALTASGHIRATWRDSTAPATTTTTWRASFAARTSTVELVVILRQKSRKVDEESLRLFVSNNILLRIVKTKPITVGQPWEFPAASVTAIELECAEA